MEYRVHQAEWTDEKVARFWNHLNDNEDLAYFAQTAGKEVLALARKYIEIRDNVLDYGTGRGYLIEHLLRLKSCTVTGCDFSPSSVEYVNDKFRGNANFQGCILIENLPSPINSDSFETVFLLETIEHLINEHFSETLSEIHRILKTGGFVVITTRNEENLNKSMVVCPDCGCVFHPVQHVKSFSRPGIMELMGTLGFETVVCETRHLGRDFFPLKQLLKLYRRVVSTGGHKDPNLIYIGRKRRPNVELPGLGGPV